MRRASRCALIVILSLFSGSGSMARPPDDDLDLIPDQLLTQPQTDSPSSAPGKIKFKAFLDEAITVSFRRHDRIAAIPHDESSSWSNRISLDVRAEMRVLPHMSLIMADRLHHLTDQANGFSEADIQNDLKECYLTADRDATVFLDVGRINLKNGVGIAFNPTDYFKKNAVSSRVSEDPAVLRETRLGTLMIRGQGLWEKSALTLALAPEITHAPDRWHTDRGSAGLALQRTNDRGGFLAKFSLNAFEDFNPEFLYFFDQERSHWGTNVTLGMGDAVIFYGEWSGAKQADLISQFISEAVDSGVIPLAVSPAFSNRNDDSFRNQLSIGLSYTEKTNRTTHIEYHFNESGMTRRDWQTWFDTGKTAARLLLQPHTAATGNGILGQLWSFRSWAQQAQQPLNRHSLFIRTHWQDVMAPFLDLTAIALINLTDGSFFIQPMAEYHLRGNITLSLTVNLFIGVPESEYGSLDPMGNVKAGITYYF